LIQGLRILISEMVGVSYWVEFRRKENDARKTRAIRPRLDSEIPLTNLTDICVAVASELSVAEFYRCLVDCGRFHRPRPQGVTDEPTGSISLPICFRLRSSNLIRNHRGIVQFQIN
jgi:hypothetical protein